ncbi:MAG: hypothetical protein LQ351_008007 [Letrouitia transgressa]|nr:MAG: hypothetical protein LQ351_008007 [Letrouitia transgressa]
MEPLSAVASVLSILKLVGTVTCYLNNVKDAPKERTRLLVEISTISGLLTTLRDLAVKSEQKGTALASVKALDVPLGRGVKRFGKVLAWPFKKEEVRELLQVIERQKSLFTLALQNDNVYATNELDHRNRALEWLRPSRLSGVHDFAKAAREPITGNWFIHGEEFKSWRQREANLLWLHGSHPSSTIIEHMSQFTRIHPECALCYYYFDWNDSEN